MRRACVLAFGLLAASARGGDLPGAQVLVESLTTTLPGQAADALPPRFALLENGQVLVGGTSAIYVGKLSGREVKDLEKRIEALRRLPGLASEVRLGPGPLRTSLKVRKGQALEITATGAPESAPIGLQPLASLLADLLEFRHPSLQRYLPGTYVASAREGRLAGGCRTWPAGEALPVVARVVSAEAFRTWPKGGNPAHVCDGGRNYLVTLRPLVPGEKP